MQKFECFVGDDPDLHTVEFVVGQGRVILQNSRRRDFCGRISTTLVPSGLHRSDRLGFSHRLGEFDMQIAADRLVGGLLIDEGPSMALHGGHRHDR